jgi:hypothetical protein
MKKINFIEKSSNKKLELKIKDCIYYYSIFSLVITEKEYKTIKIIDNVDEFIKFKSEYYNRYILINFNSYEDAACFENSVIYSYNYINSYICINIVVDILPNIICLDNKYIKQHGFITVCPF